ncbi:M28 family peptidase [Deinococcus hopiensis]|uniref:M28 family peptidase n=1 Tax=Deinococcus hopiensis TaxID=309885 RepID=UPI00148243CB|nr:M28 family peptidase [Deinococcus hopiensis]
MTARRALPTRPRPSVWKRPLPLLLVFLAVGGAWWQSRPKNVPVQAAALSRTVAQDWAELARFGPRPVGNAGHERTLGWLEGELRALGYNVTREAVTLERPYDRGGRLKVGGLSVPASALYGSQGGEQEGRLVRVSPDVSSERMEALGLRGQIALTTCGKTPWRELVERVMGAGALGLVIVQDCPRAQLQRVASTPLPLVQISVADGANVWPLAGKQAQLSSKVEVRRITGHNLIAARVGAAPEVLFGAHLDTVNGSPGANDNSSGVLAVLEVARRAARTPWRTGRGSCCSTPRKTAPSAAACS